MVLHCEEVKSKLHDHHDLGHLKHELTALLIFISSMIND